MALAAPTPKRAGRLSLFTPSPFLFLCFLLLNTKLPRGAGEMPPRHAGRPPPLQGLPLPCTRPSYTGPEPLLKPQRFRAVPAFCSTLPHTVPYILQYHPAPALQDVLQDCMRVGEALGLQQEAGDKVRSICN